MEKGMLPFIFSANLCCPVRMPRLARTVFASLPHHITQRGNRREDVFFEDGDREIYLNWLGEYAEACGVEVSGYCLRMDCRIS